MEGLSFINGKVVYGYWDYPNDQGVLYATTDPSVAGDLIATFPGKNVNLIQEYQGELYLIIQNTDGEGHKEGYEIWKTDGTQAGTVKLSEGHQGIARSITDYNNQLATIVADCNSTFAYDDGVFCTEYTNFALWKINPETGEADSLKLLMDTPPDVKDFMKAANKLFISASPVLFWQTELTEASTFNLVEEYASITEVDRSAAIADTIYFSNDGQSLWKYIPENIITSTKKKVDINNQVSLFPMSANNSVSVSFDNFSGTAKYSLTDLAGTELATGNLSNSSTSIDLSRIEPGMYLLLLNTEYGMVKKKLIKTK